MPLLTLDNTAKPRNMGKKSKTRLFDSDIQRLETIRLYIDDNLQRELKISQLAAKFGYGVSTLRRHFQQHFSLSVFNYIRQSRMVKAMSLLTGHCMPVNQVVSEVGYHDSSSFTHAFTKYYGNPPAFYL